MSLDPRVVELWLTITRDYEIASGFQRLVNKRSLPDYFEIIKEPMAFSTIRVSLTLRFCFERVLEWDPLTDVRGE